jgi:hypothetical protein
MTPANGSTGTPVLERNDDDRGLRCICGHYKNEHSQTVEELDKYGACRGAFATLAADADDFESVEVGCFCQGFYDPGPDHSWLVRL